MKLTPILFTGGIIVTSLVLTLVVPSILNNVCLGEFYIGKKKPKKKPIANQGPVFVIYSETFDNTFNLEETVIPLVREITELEIITKDNFAIGEEIMLSYRRAIEKSSLVILLIDEALIADPWLHYATALCIRTGRIKSLIMCTQHEVGIQGLPQSMQDLILVGCRQMHLNRDRNPEQFPRDLAKNIIKLNFEVSHLPVINPTANNNDMLLWKFDAYLIYDLGDRSSLVSLIISGLQDMQNVNVCCSATVPPGKYLVQWYSQAIHSSRVVIVIITPELLRNRLFDHQLRLALSCKGPESIFLIFNRCCLGVFPENETLHYAMAVCQKIYVQHDLA